MKLNSTIQIDETVYRAVRDFQPGQMAVSWTDRFQKKHAAFYESKEDLIDLANRVMAASSDGCCGGRQFELRTLEEETESGTFNDLDVAATEVLRARYAQHGGSILWVDGEACAPGSVEESDWAFEVIFDKENNVHAVSSISDIDDNLSYKILDALLGGDILEIVETETE